MKNTKTLFAVLAAIGFLLLAAGCSNAAVCGIMAESGFTSGGGIAAGGGTAEGANAAGGGVAVEDGGEMESGSEAESGGETGSGSETEGGSETGSGGETGSGSETGSGGETEGGSEAESGNATEGGVPPELVGKWTGDHIQTLEFTANGEFSLMEEEFRFTCSISVNGNRVTAYNKKGTLFGEFDYVVSGSKLTISSAEGGCSDYEGTYTKQ